MPKFRKLPVLVEATVLTRHVQVFSPEGQVQGSPGDWLVTGTEGEQYIVQAHIFPNIYKGADAAGKDMLRTELAKREKGPVIREPQPAPMETAKGPVISEPTPIV